MNILAAKYQIWLVYVYLKNPCKSQKAIKYAKVQFHGLVIVNHTM